MTPGLAGELVRFMLAVVVTILIPGAAVLSVTPRSRWPRGEFLWIYALALGLCVHPLLYLFRYLAGWRAGRDTVLSVSILLAVVLAARIAVGFKSQHWKLTVSSRALSWGLAVLLIGAGTFALRMVPLADHIVPPGPDSRGHALHGQRFLESGGIPAATLYSYHFGVHANTAVLASTTDLPVHRLQLLMQPLLMALVAVAMVVLSRKLTSSVLTGLATGVVVGFLAVFPAYYTIWGRLTMLGAVALMPIVVSEIVPDRQPEESPSGIVTTLHPALWIMTAGLLLTHYRIAAMVAFAAGALLLLQVVRRPAVRPVLREGSRLALLLGPGLLIVAPWLVHVLSRQGRTANPEATPGTRITTGRYTPDFYDFDSLYYLLDAAPTVPFLVLTGAGILFLFVRPRPGLALIPVWFLLALAFTRPYRLPLPGAGVVYAPVYLSTAAIVGSALVGSAAALAGEGIPSRWRGSRTLYVLLVLALATYGAWLSVDLPDVRPQERYVREGDIRAFEWIEENTAPDVRFLVTSVRAFNTGRVTQIDGGAWLRYFTGRRDRLPSRLEARQPQLQETISSERTYELLAGSGVTHVYLGTVGYRYIDRSRLEASEHYRRVFSHGEAAVYELVP